MYNLTHSGVLYLENREDLYRYCRRTGTHLSEFNTPIRIENHVTDCSHLLEGCTKFNQFIQFPLAVKKADNMLLGCTNFNQFIFLHTINPSILGLDSKFPISHIVRYNTGEGLTLLIGNWYNVATTNTVQVLSELSDSSWSDFYLLIRTINRASIKVDTINLMIPMDLNDAFELFKILNAVFAYNLDLFTDVRLNIAGNTTFVDKFLHEFQFLHNFILNT